MSRALREKIVELYEQWTDGNTAGDGYTSDSEREVDELTNIVAACSDLITNIAGLQGAKRSEPEIRMRIREIDEAIAKSEERHKKREPTGHPILDTIADCECLVSHLRTVRYNLLWVLGEGDA